MNVRHAKQIRAGITANRQSRLILQPMPKLAMRAFLHEDSNRIRRYWTEIKRISHQALHENARLRNPINITVYLTEEDCRRASPEDPGATRPS